MHKADAGGSKLMYGRVNGNSTLVLAKDKEDVINYK
jgi:hypothetical protein